MTAMQFRKQTLLAIDAVEQSNVRLTSSQKKGIKRAKEERHPLLWAALQNKAAHQYEQETGEKASADWGAFFEWLMENLPKILELIMKLFG
jgi:hypothetical protein